MADAKKVTRGKSLIERVLAKVPADKRESVSALITEDVLEELGGDGLRQDEFSRAMGEATAANTKAAEWKTNLDNWWEKKQQEHNQLLVDNQLLKDKLEKGGGGGGGGGNPDPNLNPNPAPVDLTSFVKKDDVEKTVQQRIAAAASEMVPLMTTLNRLSIRHFKDFNEELDLDGLVEHSRKTATPIDRGGYESFAKDKIEEKKKKADEATILAAEKRGEERARAAFVGTQPYPVGNQEPSTLDGLDKTKQHGGVDAAVNLFNKLVSQGAA